MAENTKATGLRANKKAREPTKAQREKNGRENGTMAKERNG